jgi:hypothetical protein
MRLTVAVEEPGQRHLFMKSDKEHDEPFYPSLLKNVKPGNESLLVGRESNNQDSFAGDLAGRKSGGNKDFSGENTLIKKVKMSLPKAGDRTSLSNSASTLSNDSIRAINIEKRIESRYFPFVSNTIKKEQFTTLSGLSYNLLWLVRFCLINICIASMQLSPGSQVFIILAINTTFSVIFCKAMFGQKLFSTSKLHMIGSITLEFTLEVFFIVSVVFYFNDLYEILSAQLFFILQVVCVVLIYLGVLLEVAGHVQEMWYAYKEYRERKKAEEEKAKQEKQKAAEEKENIAEERLLNEAKQLTGTISGSNQHFNSTDIKL